MLRERIQNLPTMKTIADKLSYNHTYVRGVKFWNAKRNEKKVIEAILPEIVELRDNLVKRLEELNK